MGDLQYSIQKLMDCTETLATSEGDIKTRLRHAVLTHLPMVEIESLPNDLKPLYKSIYDKLHSKKPTYRSETSIEASMYRMRKKTASIIAKDIWRLNRILQERKLTNDWTELDN